MNNMGVQEALVAKYLYRHFNGTNKISLETLIDTGASISTINQQA